MAMIENKIEKKITMTNTITVDGIMVKTQQANIYKENNTISFSDWYGDMELYEANKTEIRQKMAEFEDSAFAEKAKLVEL